MTPAQSARRVRQSAGHQALPAEILRHGIIQPVQIARGLGLAADILNLRHRGLHAEGQLIGIDAAFEHGIGRAQDDPR